MGERIWGFIGLILFGGACFCCFYFGPQVAEMIKHLKILPFIVKWAFYIIGGVCGIYALYALVAKIIFGSDGKALWITVSIFNPGSYSWDYAKENITDSVKLIVDEIDIYPFESVVYK